MKPVFKYRTQKYGSGSNMKDTWCRGAVSVTFNITEVTIYSRTEAILHAH